ncbi:M81 family metallopeptidase [Micromonospora sp. STR1s_5]|nr:M81 family metallopeptidase [Micromonospora sp. STR1s_5]
MTKCVLVAEFMHETNTFSVQATDEAAFRRCAFEFGNEIPGAYRGTRTALGAAFQAAEAFGWALVHPVVAHANPSGRVTDEVFDRVAALIVEGARGADGVLLHLHGAMSTASHDDGEGELLRRLREALGGSVPVMAVLDLHATVTDLMARSANALIAYRTYPHVDQYERSWQAARLLKRAMAGEIRPVVGFGEAADPLCARWRPHDIRADDRASAAWRSTRSERSSASGQHPGGILIRRRA